MLTLAKTIFLLSIVFPRDAIYCVLTNPLTCNHYSLPPNLYSQLLITKFNILKGYN